ncbi:MAG: hypothetical protein ACYDEC_14890 [Bacteroidia bacterium]
MRGDIPPLRGDIPPLRGDIPLLRGDIPPSLRIYAQQEKKRVYLSLNSSPYMFANLAF